MTYHSLLRGCGGYLPHKVVTNDDLAKRIDTTDEWIKTRTGIRCRHIADDAETTSYMAAQAAKEALKQAQLEPDDIDVVVVATTTPDQAFPAVAVRVQALLGMTRGAGYDISAACSGFIFGLQTIDGLIKSGKARHVLLIGSEVFSRIIDWEDRATCVLFGDGAGAMVFSAHEENDGRGILDTSIYSDGRMGDMLYVDGAVGVKKDSQFLKMKGREVFRHAVENLTQSALNILSSNEIPSHELDWLIPHQANIRIIKAVGKKLGLAEERIIVTVDEQANTSAASIPLAFNQAKSDGKLKTGQLVLMEALGGGLTWGSVLMRL